MRVRCISILGFTAAIAFTACHRGGPPPLPPGTPVVLISVDTLRADHLPAWGYGGVATPALDRLRADAVQFKEAWAPAPLTLPSHVTMLTGLLPPQHEVRANAGFTFRADQHPTLPALLHAKGYATGAAVSSYVLRAEAGLAAAFEFYDDAIDPPAEGSFAEYQRRGDVTVAAARAWVDAHRGTPFFFFLHLYEPHVPYDPPEPFRSRYGPSYDGEIASADAIVGSFLDHLREIGLYDRALVLFTSDHGEGLGDHGEDQHSVLLYAEALRVPLLVKLPGGGRAGDTVETPVQLADLLPTVTDLLGVDAPSGLAGVPLLGTAGVPVRRLYAETLYPRLALGWSELRSLADARWHFIQGPRVELYDVAADPHERTDVSARETAVVDRLRRELEREHPLRLAAPEPVPPEVAERLAALGYAGITGGASGAADGTRLDPRDGLPLLRDFERASRDGAEGRLPEAEAELRRLLARSPGLVEARTSLGRVLLDMGRAREAGDAFAAAAASPDAPGDAWVALGEARLREGRMEEARAAAERGAADSPTRAHELLARIALRGGDVAGAEREVQAAAAARATPRPSTLVLAAEVRAHAGDFAGALAGLEDAEARARALRLEAVPGLEFTRADALARLGRVPESEEAYGREIARFPRNLPAWANLAVLLHLQGRTVERDALLERMAAANPGPAAAEVAMKTLEALGERGRASVWRRRISTLRARK